MLSFEVVDKVLGSHSLIIGHPISYVNRMSDCVLSDYGGMKLSGEKLKEIRTKDYRLNQKQMAKLCGIKQPSLSSAENKGCAEMKAINFLRVCKKLNIDPEWLMNDIGKKHPYKHGVSDEHIELEIGRASC